MDAGLSESLTVLDKQLGMNINKKLGIEAEKPSRFRAFSAAFEAFQGVFDPFRGVSRLQKACERSP